MKRERNRQTENSEWSVFTASSQNCTRINHYVWVIQAAPIHQYSDAYDYLQQNSNCYTVILTSVPFVASNDPDTHLSLWPLTGRICNRKAQLALLVHIPVGPASVNAWTELTLTHVSLLLKVFQRHRDAFVFPLLVLFLLFPSSSFGFGRCGLSAHGILHTVLSISQKKKSFSVKKQIYVWTLCQCSYLKQQTRPNDILLKTKLTACRDIIQTFVWYKMSV